jgi:hypothetical protein
VIGASVQSGPRLVLSVRRFDGRVETVLGAFMALNADGWVLTVAYMLKPMVYGYKVAAAPCKSPNVCP